MARRALRGRSRVMDDRYISDVGDVVIQEDNVHDIDELGMELGTPSSPINSNV